MLGSSFWTIATHWEWELGVIGWLQLSIKTSPLIEIISKSLLWFWLSTCPASHRHGEQNTTPPPLFFFSRPFHTWRGVCLSLSLSSLSACSLFESVSTLLNKFLLFSPWLFSTRSYSVRKKYSNTKQSRMSSVDLARLLTYLDVLLMQQDVVNSYLLCVSPWSHIFFSSQF